MRRNRYKLSISPCPNDTFMFEAMLSGRIDTEGLAFETGFADIEELNRAVVNGEPDISKISYAVLPYIADKYTVLDSGSAIGRGNGPLLVGRGDTDTSDPELRIAVPGMHTTANLLIGKLFPQQAGRTPVLFSEIAGQVAAGRFDVGVLIHEGRFTYTDHGLRLIADLGSLWEQTTRLPLPLGGIAISQNIPEEERLRVERVLRKSIEYAFADPGRSRDFVKAHAQEMADEVIESHIRLFVNDFSLTLGTEGRQAVAEITGVPENKIFASR